MLCVLNNASQAQKNILEEEHARMQHLLDEERVRDDLHACSMLAFSIDHVQARERDLAKHQAEVQERLEREQVST